MFPHGATKRHKADQKHETSHIWGEKVFTSHNSIIPFYTQAPWKCQRNWGKYFYFLIVLPGNSPIH